MHVQWSSTQPCSIDELNSIIKTWWSRWCPCFTISIVTPRQSLQRFDGIWIKAFLSYCMVKRESLRIASLQGDAQGEVEAYTDSRSDAKESGGHRWSGAIEEGELWTRFKCFRSLNCSRIILVSEEQYLRLAIRTAFKIALESSRRCPLSRQVRHSETKCLTSGSFQGLVDVTSLVGFEHVAAQCAKSILNDSNVKSRN